MVRSVVVRNLATVWLKTNLSLNPFACALLGTPRSICLESMSQPLTENTENPDTLHLPLEPISRWPQEVKSCVWQYLDQTGLIQLSSTCISWHFGLIFHSMARYTQFSLAMDRMRRAGERNFEDDLARRFNIQ